MTGQTILNGIAAFLAVSMLIVAASAATAPTGDASTTSLPTSMVVDFGQTTTDLALSDGESGVLNLVIKNTGGQSAEKVNVRVYGGGSVSVSQVFYLGSFLPSESKTMPVIAKVLYDSASGISSVKVTITYDGYDVNGDKQKAQITDWNIPVRVTGKSLFRVTVPQTTYFEGALNNLTFDCTPSVPVRDVEASLSSDCLIVIGSSKQYAGAVGADGRAHVAFSIRPSAVGACQTLLTLSYKDASGTKSSEELPIGLNIEESPVDFKVVDLAYGEIGPGDMARINLTLKNEGSMVAEDAAIRLPIEDYFTPLDGVEVSLGDVAPGETVTKQLSIFVSLDAATQTYALPLYIDYKVGGVSGTDEKEIGLDVSGRVILEVIGVSSSGTSVTISVANIGTRNAESVKATLTQGGSGARGQLLASGPAGDAFAQGQPTGAPSATGQQSIDYKSDIKATKEATFTFSGVSSGTATLTLEYSGSNNQRVTQTEQITVGSGMSAASATGSATNGFRSRNGGNGSVLNTVLYAVAGVVLIYLGYRYYKKRKRRAAGDVDGDEKKGWKNLWGRI